MSRHPQSRRYCIAANRKRILGVEKLEGRLLLAAAIGRELWEAQSWPNDQRSPATEAVVGQPVSEASLVFQLNLSQLTNQLSQIPRDAEAIAGLNDLVSASHRLSSIELPTIQGGFEKFSFAYSPVYAAEFAEKFPSIRTYAGYSQDNPGTTLRFGISDLGFHAIVRSLDGDYVVDRVVDGHADNQYVAYKPSARASWLESDELLVDKSLGDHHSWSTPLRHDTDDQFLAQIRDVSAGQTAAVNSGTSLRVYRIGISANSGYAQQIGGTMQAVQSAIVESLNRINAITQNELSISFQLIANNDQLTFLNAGNDPFTANNVRANIDENIQLMDQVIGPNNYDIGHVYASGAGNGVAYVSSLGRPFKAGGATSGWPSVGFDHVVLHEIGHQMGSRHTFSGAGGACADNIALETAIEPGSGSTFMSYAGLCGADNIQNNYDPYYHSLSAQLFMNHMDNIVPDVGARIPFANALPQVESLVPSGLSIPARTPFVLEAIGSDANNPQSLTYSWEQFDLGPQRALSAGDTGQGAIIRAFAPVTESTRYVPRLPDLINNVSQSSETLPTTNRDLNFRVTVRDNFPGAGAFNTDNVRLRVVDTGRPFAVTQPNTAAVRWRGLSQQSVQWDVAGTSALPIGAVNVSIYLSLDGGFTYPIVIADQVPNTGSATITVPNVSTARARVMVRGHNNIFFDISNADFAIEVSTIEVNIAPAQTNYVENQPPVAVAATSQVLQIENVVGVTLTVSITSASQVGDFLTFINSQGISTLGNRLLLGNTDLGTWASAFAGTGLSIQFGNNADASSLETVLRSIGFVHVTDNPSSATRTVEFVLAGTFRQSVNITVQPVNDPPVISSANLPEILEDAVQNLGATVAALWSGSFVDPDSATLAGVVVVANPQLSEQGHWQYTTGGPWQDIGQVGDASGGLALSRLTRLRFTPAVDYYGTPDPLFVRALDDSYLDGFSDTQSGIRRMINPSEQFAIAVQSVTLGVVVIPVNDPPVALSSSEQVAIVQDQRLEYQFSADLFFDVDSPLTWSMQAVGGGPLPRWLSFSPASRLLTGTPRNRDVGVHNLWLIVNDQQYSASLPVTLTVQNVNDPPEQLRLVRQGLPENHSNFIVGTLFAVDPDGDPITWSSSDPRFQIVGNQVRLTTALDHEVEPQVWVTFQATDNQDPPLSASLAITFEVEDVNEHYPQLTGQAFSIPSGTAAGSLIARLLAPDDDIRQVVQFRIVDGDAVAFSLDGDTGELRLLEWVNWQVKPQFRLFVEAYDSGTPQKATTAQFVVNVLPPNDYPPEIEPSQVLRFQENPPPGQYLGTVRASDRDGTPLRFELLEVLGGEANWVRLDSATGAVTATDASRFNFENPIRQALKVRVLETVEVNGATRHIEAEIPIELSDVNDPPHGLLPVSILTARLGAVTTPLIVQDEDSPDGGYTFSSLDPRFEIRDGNLALKPDQYLQSVAGGSTTTARLLVTDQSDASSFAELLVTIQIVDRPPWQNPVLRADVNRDGRVTAQDALQVVNRLNAQPSQPLTIPRSLQQQTMFDYDVNGDNRLTAMDALIVVNFLNDPAQRQSASFPAEGEAASIQGAAADPRLWWMAFQQIEREAHNRRRR
ncbi:MAG: cadherin domain-containing protein [Pirellulaceae bacterium]|nr:cadherin domain-containing protein [Pirellulaceae bacterium]